MPALNVSPSNPILLPSSGPASVRSRSTTRCGWCQLVLTAPSSVANSTPAALAVASSARVSLGRQEPPQPGPGARHDAPIRSSSRMPSVTPSMSAPSCSHNSASVLTYDSFTARKPLLAYFTSSALVLSVSTVGALSDAYSSATSCAARSSRAPTTIRWGLRKSSTAWPSRRNSGFDTTPGYRAAVPTGTVDFSTTPGGAVLSTSSTADRSAAPSVPVGVGTQTNVKSTSDSSPPRTNLSRPLPRPATTSSRRPGSCSDTSPALNASTLASSTSAQVTRWPRWAKQAAVVRPT